MDKSIFFLCLSYPHFALFRAQPVSISLFTYHLGRWTALPGALLKQIKSKKKEKGKLEESPGMSEMWSIRDCWRAIKRKEVASFRWRQQNFKTSSSCHQKQLAEYITQQSSHLGLLSPERGCREGHIAMGTGTSIYWYVHDKQKWLCSEATTRLYYFNSGMF